MQLFTGFLTLSLPLVTASTPATAGIVYNGGTGAISFGVAPYGPPIAVAPSYIADNVTGRNDILSSPGVGTLGGYQTASPIIANNIASYAGALPLGAFQVGGGNAFGNFGSALMTNNGTSVGVALADSGPGGGSASYAIAAGVVTYSVVGAPIAAGSTYGAYLSMAGSVPLVGNADVEGLRVHISDTAGIFGAGGIDLPQLILAISRNGAGAGINNYNVITVGGAGAALILDNGVTGSFRSLAVDNQALAAPLPVGDLLTVSYALTAYADPANLATFDPTFSTDLLNQTGPLPGFLFSSTPAAVPEPASIGMMALGFLTAVGIYRNRRPAARRDR